MRKVVFLFCLMIFPFRIVIGSDGKSCIFDEVEINKLGCKKRATDKYNLIEFYKKINELKNQQNGNLKFEVIQYGSRRVEKNKLFKQDVDVDLSSCAIKTSLISTNQYKCNSVNTPPLNLVITGGTHGDEARTVDVVMDLLEEYIKKMNAPEYLKNLKRDLTIYWIPVVHPYNYCTRIRSEQTGLLRSVDPNRSFHVSRMKNRAKKMTPKEIIDLQSFYDQINPTASVDYHSSFRNGYILYPLANTKKINKDAVENFKNCDSQTFAKTSKLLIEGTPYASGKITEMGSYGAFKASASSVDYHYEKSGCMAFGIELPKKLLGRDTHNEDMKDNRKSWKIL